MYSEAHAFRHTLQKYIGWYIESRSNAEGENVMQTMIQIRWFDKMDCMRDGFKAVQISGFRDLYISRCSAQMMLMQL